LTDACVQCGLCLPHCPTYADTRCETESPRGRILVAKAIAGERIAPRLADADEALSHCLGCRACEAACPAKVDYGQILHRSRAALRAERAPPLWQRSIEWLVSKPGWLTAAFRLGRLLQPWPWLRRRLPPIPPRPRRLPASDVTAPVRGTVLLVPGCVAAHWEVAAHRAATHLLARLGWQVEELPAACCGALHRHSGAASAATSLRDRLAELISQHSAVHVLHAGSGCHEAIRDAADGLPVSEINAFLAADARLSTLRFRATTQRVALHIACTQRHVVKDAEADLALLSRVPGIELCAPAPVGCCGAAGIQALRFPAQSRDRMAALRDWYREQQPDRLLAGNLGCRLQLARELGDR
jgi:glycolate oxidase iron-sulfur subunit